MRGWGSRGLWIPAIALLGGCCAGPPPAALYFDRHEPFDTLCGFAYAVAAHEWSFAYDECLTPRSKKLFTFTRFKLAMLFNPDVPVDREDPNLQIPIRDLILDAKRDRYQYERKGRVQSYEVKYVLPGGNLLINHIFLERETEEEARAAGRLESVWQIDLDRTLLNMQGVNRAGLAAGAG